MLPFSGELFKYLVLEELGCIFGLDRMDHAVDRNADIILTLTEAERTAELDLICNIVFVDKTLDAAYDLMRTFKMAGAADTYNNLHSYLSPPRVRWHPFLGISNPIDHDEYKMH